MMNRLCSLIILIFILVALSGCAIAPVADSDDLKIALSPETQQTASPTPTANIQQPTPPESSWNPDYEDIRANFPSIDGSNPTLQLEVAVRTCIFDADNALKAAHTSTYESFQRLLPDSDNPVDMVLATDYSESYMQQAAEMGANLAQIPIAIEGFVFFVNASNPVKSISQDNLRRIYSGEITNWSELGGNDAPILAYQRNKESGSYAEMARFMGDVPLKDAEEQLCISGMGTIVEVVADPESGANAIGYNVYSFTTKQYVPISGEIRLLAIDGVAPNDATLGNGSYPLQSYFYSYYNRNNTKASKRAKMLTDWLLSTDGQRIIASVGYINLDGDIDTT